MRISSKFLAALVVTCAAILTLNTHMDVGQHEYIPFGAPRVLMSYSMGIVMWQHHDKLPNIPPVLGYLAIPAAAFVASCSMAPPRTDLALALMVNPLILLAGLSARHKIGPFLGALSFPLYAVHWPVECAIIGYGYHWAIALTGSLLAAMVLGLIADPRFRRVSQESIMRAWDFRTQRPSQIIQ